MFSATVSKVIRLSKLGLIRIKKELSLSVLFCLLHNDYLLFW